jgi:menaquinone-dependent protoporphyrinogen oxidase
MKKKVLVAYASVSGSTGEVAKAIAEVISDQGATVQVSEVADVSGLVGYGAVVLGSSIRSGQWLPGALQFVDGFRAFLSYVPVAYFTTCLAMIDSEENQRTVLAYMDSVLKLAPEVKPIGLGLFAGSLDAGQHLPATSTLKISPGDYRDWVEIRAWAAKIATSLLAERQGVDVSAVRGEVVSSQFDPCDPDVPIDQPYTGVTWADLDWDNMNDADLHGANLVGFDLSKIEMNRVNLSHAILNGADLSGATLCEADLRSADLNWANLSGADLSGANLSGASLNWANLKGATLDGVDLTKARYNQQTRWPESFSAREHGAELIGKDRPK